MQMRAAKGTVENLAHTDPAQAASARRFLTTNVLQYRRWTSGNYLRQIHR